MQLKRLLSLLCVAVLILTATAMPLYAETNETFELGVEVGTDTPISSNPMIVRPGDEVSVRINVEENTGITFLWLDIVFDDEAFELVEASSTNLFGDALIVARSSYIRFLFDSRTNVVTETGTLIEATFVAKATCDEEAVFETKTFQDNENNCANFADNDAVSAVPFVGGSATVQIHDITEEGVVTEPTCTADGYTSYVCSQHDDVVIGNIVPMLGHDYIPMVYDPTCTEQGYTEHICSRCNDTYTDTIVPEKGHDLTTVEAQAATCTEIGWEEYEYCNDCDYTTYAEIAATGHTYVDHEAQAATCTEDGWNAYQTCENCDYTTYEVVAATGHTEAEAVVENEVAATCTEAGSYDSVVYCSVCNSELSRTTESVEALGHDLSAVDAQAPTCTEDGWNAYEVCSRCDYTTFETAAATGHTGADAVSENEVAATCTEAGSYEAVVYCSVCNEELSRTTETVEALGHTLTAVEAQAATCTEDGWNAYEKCEVCDYTTFEAVAATGHTPAEEWVVTKEATYFEEGTKEIFCTVCEASVQSEAIAVLEYVNAFPDVKDEHWFADEVAYVVMRGYMKGNADGTFAPLGNVTREQFVIILANIAGANTDEFKGENGGFADVKTDAWYTGAVVWAAKEGYVSGVAEGKFGLGQSITRAQLARLLYLFAEKNGMNVEARADLTDFADGALVEKYEWMRDGIKWAVAEGIISGMTVNGELSINPNGTATRAQAAVMLKAFDAARGLITEE